MNKPVIGGVAMMDALEDDFFTETVTVYAVSTSGSDAYGKPTRTRTARAGLSNVSAAVAAVQNGKIIQSAEQTTKDLLRVDLWWRIQVANPHWEIVESDEVLWRGNYWNVNNVVVDGTLTFTEMLCELVKPRPT